MSSLVVVPELFTVRSEFVWTAAVHRDIGRSITAVRFALNLFASDTYASRILLVDDNPQVRQAMRRALSQAGLSVVEAESGDAAAKLIAGQESFDMLVTDVRMPGQRDGVALASDWREQVPGRPVLFVSGSNEDHVDAAALGAHGAVLLKPFPRASLVEIVRTLLAEASRAPG